jgi:hypothetical protein
MSIVVDKPFSAFAPLLRLQRRQTASSMAVVGAAIGRLQIPRSATAGVGSLRRLGVVLGRVVGVGAIGRRQARASKSKDVDKCWKKSGDESASRRVTAICPPIHSSARMIAMAAARNRGVPDRRGAMSLRGVRS